MIIEQSSIIHIENDSRIPKYQQIVNSIIKNIESDVFSVGDKIPSINEISEQFYLSRDTVEKAYNQLKKKKIIVSVKGKGYYVVRSVTQSQIKILFLLNKLSTYKLNTYNSFLESLGSCAKVDLHLYHCDPKILLNIIEENLGGYDYYVVMPHFKDENMCHQSETESVVRSLNQIPKDKLIIMDNLIPSLVGEVASIYQDFKADIYKALKEGIARLQKYEKLILVFPNDTVCPYPSEIKLGFQQFCSKYDFDFEIIETVYPEMDLKKKDAYILIEENDLVSLIKQTRDQHLTMGVDIGVISYNDTPLKELLGITAMSTDFKVMGETAAYMIKKKKYEVVKNVFNFIDRGSI